MCNNHGCRGCANGCKANARGKKLCREEATSILCNKELLEKNKQLEKIAENGENKYYAVAETNVVIMHVEKDFCILVDNMVSVYNDNEKCCLPKMLSAQHYAIYQQREKSWDGREIGSRDWTKSSKKGRPLGHDIQDMVYGNGAKLARAQKKTLDHGAETYNELLRNCRFKTHNYNDGSHRRRVVIKNELMLNGYINAIKIKEDNAGYIL